ncbi:hypothetical protein MNBD_ALPHA04-1169 [hydrothermal vent metagenome]|uniref:DUF2147 domain-containing protein n=1 Tax=hydrothermal vent metagenome TaxID=652676 RepID=A0A3B0RA09_9ZZZZ
MKTSGSVSIATAIGAIALLASPAIAASPAGTYERENGDTVEVSVNDDRLYCKITAGKKPNFEMCHGMTQSGEKWTGKKMKHPGMPKFMTFNGTVTYDATSLKIKGCAMGKMMCDKETWKRVE